MNLSIFPSFHLSLSKRGFTLVELIVSIALITVLSGILLGSRRQFADKLNLKNQTYNVVLAVRQAQVESLAVKPTGSPQNFAASYGVHFDSGYATNIFKYFTDSNLNGRFDNGEPNQDVTLLNVVVRQNVCGNNGSSCFGGNFTQMSVTFRRPSATSRIRFMNNGGNDSNGVNPPAIIYLVSPAGAVSSVKVESTGSVSVQGL